MKRLLILMFTLVLLMTITSCSFDKKEEVNKYEVTVASPLGTEGKGIYTGTLINGSPDGVGRITYATGIEYYGEFKDGLMQGNGKALIGINYVEGIFEKGKLISGKLYTFTEHPYEYLFEGAETLNDEEVQELENKLLSIPAEEYFNKFKDISQMQADGDLKIEKIKREDVDALSVVLNGNGKLFNKNGEIVYEGEFQGGIPVDVEKFKSMCKEMMLADIYKNIDLIQGDLIKVSIKADFITNHSKNEISVGSHFDETFFDSKTCFFDYVYRGDEERIMEDEFIMIYGRPTEPWYSDITGDINTNVDVIFFEKNQ